MPSTQRNDNESNNDGSLVLQSIDGNLPLDDKQNQSQQIIGNQIGLKLKENQKELLRKQSEEK